MKHRILAFILAITVLLSFTGCIPEDFSPYVTFEMSGNATKHNGILTVHFIDVGQADCELIELPNGKTMLIDAGNNDDGDLILDYLKELDITEIDYLIGTHPHEDHIGSLDTVIDNLKIGRLYMPSATATTKTYKDVISSAEENGIDIIETLSNTTIYSDSDLKIATVAPTKEYTNLNNASIVIRLTYKKASFLFTGDAEAESENNISADISADVLKVGHHGSSTSTSDYFLERIDPMYAVISCGKGNSYGHPHYETLEKLENNDVTVYRTDQSGTIICRTSGNGPADYNWEAAK